jgi:hypothetical protein
VSARSGAAPAVTVQSEPARRESHARPPPARRVRIVLPGGPVPRTDTADSGTEVNEVSRGGTRGAGGDDAMADEANRTRAALDTREHSTERRKGDGAGTV